MSEVYLGLGTNLGDKLTNLVEAVHALTQNEIHLLETSSVYETPAWGFESEDPFYNCVLKVETNLAPEELLNCTKKIEISLGRTKKNLNGYESRIIDIDILFIDTKVINTDELVIPHRFFDQRLFVLLPMLELNPLFINVLTGETIEWHFKNSKDKSEITKAVTNIEFAKKIEDAYGLKKK